MQENFNPQKIKLIIGLGNPNQTYHNTYHNTGHLFIDYLEGMPFETRSKIMKTDSAMNRSGDFVKNEIKKRNLKPAEILIVHDDSDIALDAYKFAFDRGAAGHKGVESIIKILKTKKFWRLRIGIRPPQRAKAEEFVLKKISGTDRKKLETVFEKTAEALL